MSEPVFVAYGVEYDSVRFRSLLEGHEAACSSLTLALILAGLLLLL